MTSSDTFHRSTCLGRTKPASSASGRPPFIFPPGPGADVPAPRSHLPRRPGRRGPVQERAGGGLLVAATLRPRRSERRTRGYRTAIFGNAFTTDEAPTSDAGRNAALTLLANADPFLNEEKRACAPLVSRKLSASTRETALRETSRGPISSWRRTSLRTTARFSFVSCEADTASITAVLGPPVVVRAPNESTKRLLELAGLDRDRIVQHDVGVRTRIDHALLPGYETRTPTSTTQPIALPGAG